MLLKGSGERRRVSNREKRVFWPSTTTRSARSGATITLRKNLGSFGLLTQYLQKTRITIRKWIHSEADMAENDAGGWRQLKQR